jgi:hypothetical protein
MFMWDNVTGMSDAMTADSIANDDFHLTLHSEGVFAWDQPATDEQAVLAAADEAEADYTSLCALLQWEAASSSASQLAADVLP